MRWDIFRELPSPAQFDHQQDGPPRLVRIMRWFGASMFAVMISAAFQVDPKPALSGRGLGVALSLVGAVVALPASLPRRNLPPFQRVWSLALLGASSIALTAFQPDGAGVIGIYIVVVVAALRLPLAGALIVCSAGVGAEVLVMALFDHDPGGKIFGLLTSIVPWLLVMRLLRNLRQGRDEAEALVVELRESQVAEAQAAALAERGRVARDMHDVLAHALSALALQLESARLLARDRGADPDVTAAVERAHGLAASGLEEARRAIGALRGDALPGPEALQTLIDTFCESSGAECRLTVDGAPRELDSEARLALYRTAQEALTNVRKHATPERVDVVLTYEEEGTGLVVSDHGRGMPVAVGGIDGTGGGYGITGMRERAELLGGQLAAGPTDDGFRVALWLPA